MFALTRLISRKVISSHCPPNGRVPICIRPGSSGSSWSRDFTNFPSHHRTKPSIAAFAILLDPVLSGEGYRNGKVRAMADAILDARRIGARARRRIRNIFRALALQTISLSKRHRGTVMRQRQDLSRGERAKTTEIDNLLIECSI
jgi:hypothetical protein